MPLSVAFTLAKGHFIMVKQKFCVVHFLTHFLTDQNEIWRCVGVVKLSYFILPQSLTDCIRAL